MVDLVIEDVKQIAQKLRFHYNLITLNREEIFVLAFTEAFEYFKKLQEHDEEINKRKDSTKS